MFTVTVPMQVRRLILALEEDDDGQLQRMCRTTLRRSMFTYDLAKQFAGVAIVRHCFDEKDQRPRWDVNDIHFTPPEAHYTVNLQPAPDMPATATLLLATVEKIRVWRPKITERDLALELVLVHELARGDARDLAELLTVWEGGATYVTFTNVQRTLDLEPREATH